MILDAVSKISVQGGFWGCNWAGQSSGGSKSNSHPQTVNGAVPEKETNPHSICLS